MKNILYISILFLASCTVNNYPDCPELDSINWIDSLRITDSTRIIVRYDTTHIQDTNILCIETIYSEDILREWESDLLTREREFKLEQEKLESEINEHVEFVDSINQYAKSLNEFKDFTNLWVQNKADSLSNIYSLKDSAIRAVFQAKNQLIYDFISDTIKQFGGMYKNEKKNIVIAPIWRNDSLKTF